MKILSLVTMIAVVAVANSNILDVYKNRVILHQTFDEVKNSLSIQVPADVLLEDIEVSSSCAIKNISLGIKKPLENDIFKENETYNQKIDKLNNKIRALIQKGVFLSKLNPKANSNTLTLKNDANDFYKEYLANLNAIDEAKQELKNLRKNEPFNYVKYTKNLDIAFKCSSKSATISYPLFDSKFSLKNHILADTKANKIEIIQGISIKNPLWFDIKANINLYPFYYTSRLNPPDFYPYYENKTNPETRVLMSAANANVALGNQKNAKLNRFKKSYDEIEGSYKENALSNLWQIKDANLKANEKSELVYNKQSFSAKFDIVIDGYAGHNAYERAVLEPNIGVETAQTSVDINGINIARNARIGLREDEKNYIYFGRNSLIDVKKEKVTDYTKDSFLGGKHTTSEKWLYTIKNNSKITQNILLIERLPISKHEDIKITNKTSLKALQIKPNGEISYGFELKPGEKKKFAYAYDITKSD